MLLLVSSLHSEKSLWKLQLRTHGTHINTCRNEKMKVVVLVFSMSVLVVGCARYPEPAAPAPAPRVRAEATVRTVRPEPDDIAYT